MLKTVKRSKHSLQITEKFFRTKERQSLQTGEADGRAGLSEWRKIAK